MTANHVPEGYIGFQAAFDKYCMKVAQTDFKKHPEELADQRDQQEKLYKCADSFVAVFAAGELTGFFSNQGLRRNDAVSEADWASPVCTLACWRGRLDIEGKSRVIFINEAAFSKWLSGVRKGGGKPRTKPGRPRVQGVLAENAIRALYPKGGG